MDKALQFLHLPPAEQNLLLQCTVSPCAVRLGLWLLPFRTVCRLLAKMSHATGPVVVGNPSSTLRIARAVRVASRWVPGATCLAQALVTQVLLARQGQSTTLRIGVLKSETGWLQAHAWLERDGDIVIGGSQKEIAGYTRLPLLDGSDP